MSDFFRTKQFQQLQRDWYARLRQSGFKDCETYLPKYGSCSQDYLVRSCKDLASKYSKDTFEHFHLARQFYIADQFEGRLPKLVWYYYCEGLSLRETAKELNKLGKKCSYFWVFAHLKTLKAQFRTWLINQALKESKELDNE